MRDFQERIAWRSRLQLLAVQCCGNNFVSHVTDARAGVVSISESET